jgi:hypothetical protein
MKHIENRLHQPTQDTLYLLDIDSTLVTTHQRNTAILKEFCRTHSQDFPEECSHINKMECQLGDYGYHSVFARHGLDSQSLDCQPTLSEFWRKHFFSNNYLHHDRPTPGALEWTKKLQQAQVPFIYLTARHHGPMWDGTLSSMAELGFPIAPEILFLKQNLELSDEEYKAQKISQIRQQYPQHQILLIDNEPVVLHKVLQQHSDILLCWYDLTHSGKKEPPPQALAIKDFLAFS